MKKITLFLLCLVSFNVFAQTPSNVLPFGVKLGGQDAVLANPTDIFARVSQAITSDAELEVMEPVSGTLIVNAFHTDNQGNIDKSTQNAPEILFASGTNKTRINQTMSKNPLKPGFYLANIVANGRTARVVFEVK